MEFFRLFEILFAMLIGYFQINVVNAIRSISKFRKLHKFHLSATSALIQNNALESVDYENFSFNIHKTDAKTSKARLGTLKTPHGIIETPNFVFCATKAAMKGLTPSQVIKFIHSII